MMKAVDSFLKVWDREHKTTARVLAAYPQDKAGLKPAEKSKSAIDLAWMFVMEQAVLINGVLAGKFDFAGFPPPPATFAEIIARFEADYPALVEKVSRLSDDDLNEEMLFMVGPKTPGMVRKGDLLWMAVMDMIHHRGQFSVYLRMADAKVPSIYGPTADEPWM
jgi:uncharacterized damage-inducible protein DinB